MAAALVIFATAAVAMAANSPVPGSDEILYGFDAVRGTTLSQVVPLTYEKGRTWAHPLRPKAVFAVPDQAEVHVDAVSDITDSLEVTLNQWLNERALEFGLPAGNLGFLGLSAEFKVAHDHYVTQLKSMHERRELLGYLQLVPVAGSLVASGFDAAAARLPLTCATYDELSKYVSFYKEYGTHYISFVRMGAHMHMTAEFETKIIGDVDIATLNVEISTAWGNFIAGPTFENDRISQTNHTTVRFIINGGDIYRKYSSMEEWKSTVPDNPAVMGRTLTPIYEIIPATTDVNPACFEAALRLYYAENISPKRLDSHKLETNPAAWSDDDLKVMAGYGAAGFSIDFGGTCHDYCENDGPIVNKLAMIGTNWFGFYEQQGPQNITVKGKQISEWKNVEYQCPDNSFLAGLQLTWNGDCDGQCAQDASILHGIDLICHTPHTSAGIRLLSDPDSRAVPDIKTVYIQAEPFTVNSVVCPDDHLVESITVRVAGRCHKQCDKDGSVIQEFALQCRNLNDYAF